MPPLVIIPARTGSKGIPQKNWRPLVGKTPVDRAVECCRAAGLEHIFVSTDATVEVKGAEMIYCPGVHQDESSAVDVVLNALWRIPDLDPILYVQPTQPLREPKHLKWALEQIKLRIGASVASIVETEPMEKCFHRKYQNTVERRQDATKTYHYDGTVYGFTRKDFLKRRDFSIFDTTIEIPKSETCKLDDEQDWIIAERLLRGISLELSEDQPLAAPTPSTHPTEWR